ncbi:MAG: hypothetical protein ACD_75C00034G0002 [uncultured bacterium]|nr:MAG: hypothetical protein ACD_75C00034G0002 [uncultured bacterium]
MIKPPDAPSTLLAVIASRPKILLMSLRFSRIFTRGALLTCFLLLASILVCARGNFTLDAAIVDAAAKKYGNDARRNLLAWQQFIRDDDSTADLQKLKRVNSFFNKHTFVDDSIHWNQKDYWATPIEFLATDGGDCEDFALAKYFTLKLIGVAEEKLNLTYVKALNLNQAHMVLTYYEKPGAVPLVLDNLIDVIEPATKRTDLLPVYTFNGSGLWLAKERGKGNLVGKSDRLKLWNDLLDRMPASLR